MALLVKLVKVNVNKSQTVLTKPSCEREMISSISIDQLSQLVVQKAQIIDTRSCDEYNGWDLDTTGLSGHIPSALSFPSQFFNDRDIIKDLQLNIQSPVVLYGNEAHELGLTLKKKGFDVYYFNILSGVGKMEFIRLPNYKVIVPVEYIKKLVIDGIIDQNLRKYKLFCVGGSKENRELYILRHIPSAGYLNTNDFEEPVHWNKRTDEEIEKVLTNNGITEDTTIFLYGENNMAPSRVGIIAKYAGVKDVRLINGGFPLWLKAGYPIEKGDLGDLKGPVPNLQGNFTSEKNYINNMDDVKLILKGKSSQLISIRSFAEHVGKTSGYDYIHPKGRIPGDVWGRGGEHPQDLADYHGYDNLSMKPYPNILEMWEELGIDKNKYLCFYCGTGWRASEVWFYAHAMGVNAGIYDGGWLEWSSYYLNT